MSNTLAKKHSIKTLLIFTVPNIVMMIFLSLYTIVDGIFISQYEGTIALSAVNIIYPAVCLQLAIGIMLATGASAVIAKKMGEGKSKEARADFSLIMIVGLLAAILVAVIGILFIDEIVRMLGASEAQFELCRTYGIILFGFAPAFFLQTLFQTFFVTAGRPGLGLLAVVGAGLTNMVLDYVFIGIMGMGIAGAAIATGIGYCIPAVIGIIFFFLKKGSLYFEKPVLDGALLIKSCTNGSSEMVTNLANAVTTFLFNRAFMRYFGEDGVASITIVLYFQFVFSAVHFGYSMGVAPLLSYKYGCRDKPQLKMIMKSSLRFVTLSSVLSWLFSILLVGQIMMIFTGKGSPVYSITMEGFPLFAIGFLFMGISIFASAVFTAFSDGKVSALISFTRTFLFLTGAILLMPTAFGETGVWLAMPVAEALGAVVSVVFLIRKKKVYGY